MAECEQTTDECGEIHDSEGYKRVEVILRCFGETQLERVEREWKCVGIIIDDGL